MPIIQIPDLALKLQRNLRLTHLPDSILGQETVPVIVVDDYSGQGVGNACMATGNVGPTAAENSHVELVRTSVGYRCFVTMVQVFSTATQYIGIFASTEDIPGTTPQASTGFTDFNKIGRPASICAIDTSAVLPTAQEIGRVRVLAHHTVDVPLGIFLGDLNTFRHKLMVGAISQNIQIGATFHFIELPPEG